MTNTHRVSPIERIGALNRAIANNGWVRLIEAHSGLSGIVGETARVEVGDETRTYDGFWESSLTDSASKGLPDASIIGTESRLQTINEILQVTSLPMLVDGDTGGDPAQFEYMVTQLERIGISGVIIEDKVFPKRNSLDPTASQVLEDPFTFARKITTGKAARVGNEFLVIARLESLIAGTGLTDAIERAERYIDAGADGLMIHSNQREPDDLFAFVDNYEKMCARQGRRPVLVGVPTSYNQNRDDELAGIGFNILIHANHLLRAAHLAMENTAHTILKTGRSLEADAEITSVSRVFSVVGFDRLKAMDREGNQLAKVPIVIPAAGKDPIFPTKPKSLIVVGGKPILDHQLESIRKAGMERVVIIKGHAGEQFDTTHPATDQLTYTEHANYRETHSLESLAAVRSTLTSDFILLYSDILFDHKIPEQLVNTGKHIVIGIDGTYRHHKHNVDKRLDLVVARRDFNDRLRSLQRSQTVELVRIGKDIEIERADYEFIGMAYFSAEGAQSLWEAYEDMQKQTAAPFHEAAEFRVASITDMLQDLIERGYVVHGLKIDQGWMEIHNHDDIKTAESEIALLR